MSNVKDFPVSDIDLTDPYEHAAEIRKKIARVSDPIVAAEFELRLFALLHLDMMLAAPEELDETE